MCTSCLQAHPMAHLACQTFWARSAHIVSLLPPSRMTEKELYTIHHDLMSSDWVLNAWNVRVAHDDVVHWDWILQEGIEHQREGGAAEGGGDEGGDAETVDSESCRESVDHHSQTPEHETTKVEGNELQILSPSYLEHTCKLELPLLAEIDYGALSEAMSEMRTRAGADGQGDGNSAGESPNAQRITGGWFVRVLVYSKDATQAFIELHLNIPSPSELIRSRGPRGQHGRGGEGRQKGGQTSVVIEIPLDLTQLVPHIPLTSGPFSEIAIAVLVYERTEEEMGSPQRMDGSGDAVWDDDKVESAGGGAGSQARKISLAVSQQAHSSSPPLPEPTGAPKAAAHTRLILRHGCISYAPHDAPPPTAPSSQELFLPPTPARVAAFARVSRSRCGFSRFGGGEHRFCGFENVIYRRESSHAHVEYYPETRCEALGADPREDAPAAEGAGFNGSGFAECPPRLINMVHPLKCCPAYHASVRVQQQVQPMSPETCEAFVDQDAYLFGVINAQQYGHVLHETMMALFHTILTFSPSHASSEHGGDPAGERVLPTPPSRTVVLISDVLDPPQMLGKWMGLLQMLSDVPWLSMSALRQQGRAVCFRRLNLGLSDRMNMFATADTLAHEPHSSPIGQSRFLSPKFPHTTVPVHPPHASSMCTFLVVQFCLCPSGLLPPHFLKRRALEIELVNAGWNLASTHTWQPRFLGVEIEP